MPRCSKVQRPRSHKLFSSEGIYRSTVSRQLPFSDVWRNACRIKVTNFWKFSGFGPLCIWFHRSHVRQDELYGNSNWYKCYTPLSTKSHQVINVCYQIQRNVSAPWIMNYDNRVIVWDRRDTKNCFILQHWKTPRTLSTVHWQRQLIMLANEGIFYLNKIKLFERPS